MAKNAYKRIEFVRKGKGVVEGRTADGALAVRSVNSQVTVDGVTVADDYEEPVNIVDGKKIVGRPAVEQRRRPFMHHGAAVNALFLQSCKGHDFSVLLTQRVHGEEVPTHYRCTNCKGEVTLQEKQLYEEGQRHLRAALLRAGEAEVAKSDVVAREKEAEQERIINEAVEKAKTEL